MIGASTTLSAESGESGSSACGLLILLVEDEPADAHLLRVALSESRIDAQLEHVFDGREGLEYLRRQCGRSLRARRPDLILLDLNMPRMDGREFLAAVKDDPSLSDIPVVVLSTSIVERDVLAARRLGAVDYIAKSADVDVFIEEIRRLGEYWSRVAFLAHNGKRTDETVEATEKRK